MRWRKGLRNGDRENGGAWRDWVEGEGTRDKRQGTRDKGQWTSDGIAWNGGERGKIGGEGKNGGERGKIGGEGKSGI